MPSFVPLRNRDAWSTIRGYVYQVDLTIQRWLDLEPNQILELERGEDIDIIGRALLADSEEQKRLLEQVKHIETSLTLKTAGAVAAIANFVEHCQTNPTANLIFQFTTNTKIGIEQESPIPNRVAAIKIWEEIRSGELEERKLDESLEGIREILKNVNKPLGLPDNTWHKFSNFIDTSTNEEFIAFIRKFEWRTEAPEAQSIKLSLQLQLLDRNYAIDNLQAKEQYQRLFLYVFNRLCERGRKQLTLEERSIQLSLPSLSSNDHKTLETLKGWFYEIDIRVTELEQGLQQTNQLVKHLGVEVKQLTQAQGIDAAINYVVETPILDIYPLVEHSSLREETVQNLVQILENHTWIAIDGSLGSGKTQLAVLLVQYLISQGNCTKCKWFRFRDLTIEQACLRFDRAIEALVGHPSTGSLNQWYSELTDILGANTILVFDDLPRLAGGDELENRLIQLAQVGHNKGIHLLSTSFYQLPQNLQQSVGSQIIHTIKVPAFTNSEATELFRAYNAPNSFLDPERVSSLNGLANYHPSLLAAIAVYLHRQNWQFSEQTIDSLLRGDHNIDINEETLNRILVAIQDERSQELLYRLNLVLGHFSIEDMQALADVSPHIERPRQQLNNLIGVWIQRDVNNYFRVSPLVKVLGSQDISINVRQECYLILGERIVCTDLDQYNAFSAICYFIMAEAFNKAGSLLLVALSKLEDHKVQIDDGGLLTLWSQRPLPEQMDLGIRLLVRNYQILLGFKLEKSTTYLLNDLDSLIDKVTIQEGVMVMSVTASFIGKCPEQVGFLRLNRYLRTALHLSSEARLPDGRELSLPNETPFELLIWIITRNIQSKVDIDDWIVTLEQLTNEQKERTFSNRLAEAACLSVANTLGLLEGNKPENKRDWQSTLIATRKLAESSSNLGLELLWACAIRAEVNILVDYNRNLNKAMEVTTLAITRASDDARVQLLLKECLGRQFIFAGRHSEAVTCLTQALSYSTESYPLLRLRTFLSLSQAISNQEPYLAIQYAQQAVNLAQASEEIPETELIKALGELAISKWLAIDLSAAFEVWDKAGECLLKYRRDNNLWKDVFVLYAHITGYFMAIAATGSPPNNIENGESYTAPFQGIFLAQKSTNPDSYNPTRDCLLPTQLAFIAEAIGNDECALRWSIKGMEMSREAEQLVPRTSLIRIIIPHLVLENRYAEVFDLAVEVGILLVALNQLGQSGKNILESGINIQSVLGSTESETWRQAESCSLIYGVLPIIFHIANIAIHQPELAKSQAIDLSTICQEISSVSGTQSLWATTVIIINQIHLQQSTYIELINQYQNLNSYDYILSILGLMAATLQENIPLTQVFNVHLYIIDQVQRLTNSNSTTWRKIILPYFFNYWKTAVEKVMFRFDNPQQVASMMYQVQDLPIEKQGQAILSIIQNSLII